jgi:hypothetical protein
MKSIAGEVVPLAEPVVVTEAGGVLITTTRPTLNPLLLHSASV